MALIKRFTGMHIYFISINLESDHSTSLKFIEGHLTSRIKRAFQP